jgi:hypothetical protein
MHSESYVLINGNTTRKDPIAPWELPLPHGTGGQPFINMLKRKQPGNELKKACDSGG